MRLAEARIPLGLYAVLISVFGAAIAVAYLFLSVAVAARNKRAGGQLAAAVLAALAASAVGTGETLPGSEWLRGAATIGLFWLLSVYPTINFTSRWAAVPVGVATAWTFILIVVPSISLALSRGEQPWASLEGLVYSSALLGVLCFQAIRFRKGTAVVRRQLDLLLLVIMLVVLVGLAWSLVLVYNQGWGPGSIPHVTALESSGLLMLLAAACIAWAIVRHQALGIFIQGSVVGVLLSIVFFGVYATVMTLASVFLQGWLPPALAAFLAAGVLAFIFRPIARRIENLVYGDAESPEALLAMLSGLLAAATADRPVFRDALQAVTDRLQFSGARVHFADGRTVQSSATDGVASTVESLLFDSALLGGTLEIGTTAPGRRLTRRLRRALTAAAGPLAIAANTDRLTESLRMSRLQLVASREEERRFLRALLHDDVVPTMASARLRITAARDLSNDSKDVHLSSAEVALESAILALRELSRSLRPPALDTLGLLKAIEEFSQRLSIPTTVSSNGLEDLPAVIESAAYRIAVESLLNAERHSKASVVSVSIARSDSCLDLQVADNGIGFRDQPWGVGLVGIQDRVAELGGTFSITDTMPQGLTLSCQLPLRIETT